MTDCQQKTVRLGAYLSYGTGHHAAGWRHRDSVADGAQSIEHYIHLATLAERGLFDFIFLSDTPSIFNDSLSGFGGRPVVFEPMTLLSAIAMHTRDIGLIATGSTTYKEPYNLAREFASLDLLSGGRAGWNMVTSSKPDAALNFGLDGHPDHAQRYRRATEFNEVVRGLWDSWDDDAFIRCKESGEFYDVAKRHSLNHRGEFFKVRGPLNIQRPVQGYPVLVQAGSSETGRELAARFAEVVFTARGDLASAQAFYRDVKSRLANYGRSAENLYIMPGLSVYTGSTEREARELFEHLQSLIKPELGLAMLSDMLGQFDISQVDVDGPLPRLPPSNGNQSRRAMIEKMAYEDGLTVRQIYQKLMVSRGHVSFVGSYDAVAEMMRDWVLGEAADGFNIMPPYLPGALTDFVDHVIPRLQELGVYKTEYAPGTLRDKLDLPRPQDRRRSGPHPAPPAVHPPTPLSARTQP